MSQKLYVRKGGGASTAVEVMDMATPRKGAPVLNENTPLINLGRRAADGEASQGTFLLYDPEAEIHSSTYRLSPHALVTWTEDASGDELWLARSRIAPLESGRRGIYIGGDEIEWEVTANDNNIDLRLTPFTEPWERPAETDIERIIALQAYMLNGNSSTAPHRRKSCNITVDLDTNDHLVSTAFSQARKAKTYPVGTEPQEVIAECAERAGKTYAVVIHHADGDSHDCLLYKGPLDHTTYQTDVKVSDHRADWDPDDATAPVFEPIWDRGKGTSTDNDEVWSGVVVIYGGTNDEPKSVFVHDDADEDPYEYAVGVVYDEKSETEAEAQDFAEKLFTAHRAPGHRTHRFTILIKASQHHLICAGMSMQVKSAVIAGGDDLNTYVWRQITELRFEPHPDPDYLWAHIDLDKPLRRRGSAGQPKGTSPKPPPECEPPDEAGLPDSSISADWRGGADPMRVDPKVGGAAAIPWGTGQQGPAADGITHTNVQGSGTASQWFTVTGGGRVVVSVGMAAIISSPVTGALLGIKFDDPTDTAVHWEGNVYSGRCGAGDLPLHPLIWSYWSVTVDVPAGATYANVRLSTKACVQYLFAGDEVTPIECPPYSIPPGTGGDSPYYLPSDAPILTADDAHLITKLSQRVVNNSGDELGPGDVVIPDITFDGQGVTTTTTASLTDARVGVVETGGADGEDMVVIWEGSIESSIPVTSAAADGDYLYTSTTAGSAAVSGTRSSGAVGRVIRDEAGNPVYTLWWGVPDSGGGSGDVATDAIWDAKGDLAAGTGANTAAKLTAGANDTILMADSAQSTGLKWVASATPSTQAFGDTAATGTADTFTRGDHKHAMPADPVTAHEAAGDPHTGYRLESADHSHATTGLQAGQLVQANTHQSPDTDTGTGSLHHTIGSSATQSAAGNHSHAGSPGGDGWSEITKSGDQTVTNNGTPQDDTELFFTCDANSGYAIELYIQYSGNNATGDYVWRLTYPTLTQASQSNGFISVVSTNDTTFFGGIIGGTTQWPTTNSAAGTDASDTIRPLYARMMFVSAASGTVQFQFANNTAASGRTSTTRAGSKLRYRKLT